DLLHYATSRLSEIEGIRVIGTAAQKSSVISFVVDGVHPYDIGVILYKLGVTVRTEHHCAQPVMDSFSIPGTVGVSLAMYNTKEEVDVLMDGLRRAVTMLL